MRIIPFPRKLAKAAAPAEIKSQDWSQQEIADFYRAHRLLVENGVGIGIDRGVSDIGEPWMVFFDSATHDVFMHVARIDYTCHLICEPLGIRLSAANIEALIADFENTVRGYLALRAERNSNVVLHPAARIIMSISAVFLLFKLNSGEAHAKVLAEKTAAHVNEAGTARTVEKSASAIARAQAAFARAFDVADAPAAAILAGIILAGELSAFHEGNEPKAVSAAPKDVASSVDLDLPHVTQTAESPVERKTPVVVAEVNHFEAPPKPEIVAELRALRSEAAAGSVAEQKVELIKVASLDTQQLQQVAAAVAAKIDDAEIAPVQKIKAAPAETTTTQAAPESQAMQAMEVLVAAKINTVAIRPLVSSDQNKIASIVIDNSIGAVSVNNLDTIDDRVGFFLKTHFDEAKLYSLMQHFAKEMGPYDFEYASGKVLVEEKNIDSVDANSVGLWTNVMNDGSTFSVVGHATLIDDVLTFFS